MAVRAFDRPVLVRYATIVARRLHAGMRAQRLVAPRLILPRVVVEVAEGGGQAVAAMLQRGAAECPQRILQPLGQCHKRSVGGIGASAGVMTCRQSGGMVWR